MTKTFVVRIRCADRDSAAILIKFIQGSSVNVPEIKVEEDIIEEWDR